MNAADRDALIREYLADLCEIAVKKLGKRKSMTVCVPGPGRVWITFAVRRLSRKEAEVMLVDITNEPTVDRAT